MRRLISAFSILVYCVGIIFIVLFAVEFAPDLWKRARLSWTQEAGVPRKSDDDRLAADAYQGLDWPPYYFKEAWTSRYSLEWHPYVYWRRKPFTGKYVNVDKRGLRHTWNKEPPKGIKPFRIFMFGGSVMWGFGARDDFSIPSFLAKKLVAAQSRPVEVTNFGEGGYVSTQEMLKLMLELREGNTPDLVIFLDGFNDIVPGMLFGEAGVTQNEVNRAREFNILNKYYREKFYAETAKIVFRRTLRAVRKTGEKLGLAKPKEPGCCLTVGPVLAGRIINYYAENLDVVAGMAVRNGFQTIFIWQPFANAKQPRTDYEEEVIKRERLLSTIGSFDETYRNVSAALKAEERVVGNRNFYDFRDIYDGVREGIFIDRIHLSEKGNDVLAEALLPLVMERMKSGQ